LSKAATVEKVAWTLLEAKPAMAAAYGPRRCIVCSRIAVEACRAAKLKAVAVPVEVNITMPSGFEAHMGFDPPGTVQPSDWNGHLVAVIEHRTLLDLTLDSMRVPAAGLEPGPLVSPVPREFVKGEPVTIEVPDGIEVEYTPHLEDRDYLNREDWNDKPERDRVLGDVLRQLGGGPR
jgi:hypothetical protein